MCGIELMRLKSDEDKSSEIHRAGAMATARSGHAFAELHAHAEPWAWHADVKLLWRLCQFRHLKSGPILAGQILVRFVVFESLRLGIEVQ